MKQNILKVTGGCLIFLFILTALCLVISQSSLHNLVCFDGKTLELLGQKYAINESFINAVKNILSFNKKLFGAFVWESIIQKTQFFLQTIIDAVETYGNVLSKYMLNL